MRKRSSIIAIGVIAALIVVAAFAVSMVFAGSPLQTATTGTPGTAAGTTTGTPATQQAQSTPVPPRYVRIWSSMCVEGVPYTLLSVPPDAKFAVVEEQKASSGPIKPSASLTPLASSGTGVPVTGGTGTSQASTMTGPGTPQVAMSTGTPQAGSGTGVPVTGGNGSLGIVPSQNSCTAMGTISGQQMVMCSGPQANTFTLYVHGSQGTETYHGQLWDCTAAKPTATKGPGGNLGPTGAGTGAATDTPAVANTPATPMPVASPTP